MLSIRGSHRMLAPIQRREWGGNPAPLYRYYSPALKKNITGRQRKFSLSARKAVALLASEGDGNSWGLYLRLHVSGYGM